MTVGRVPEPTTWSREEEHRLLGVLREMGVVVARRRYRSGSAIHRRGEERSNLCVLLEGAAKILVVYPGSVASKEAILGLLGPLDVFGRPVFAGDRKGWTVTAEAITDCEVAKVPKASLERVIRRRPEVALELATLSELALVEQEEFVGCLLPYRTEARLANLLPILARKFGEPAPGGGTIVGLRLTRQDLAAMTATTRESITAAIFGLRDRGVIRIERGRVMILDHSRLAEIARG